MRFTFILILATLIWSGTLSPQFLIWAAPFAAFLGMPGALMFIGASSLTWVYFKYWDDLIRLAPLATSVLISRNLLLVILLVYESLTLVKSIFGSKKSIKEVSIK